MGYEIWDRDDAALVADFDDEDQALDYLRRMVRSLTAEAAARRLDRLQLVRVIDNGTTTQVIAAGVDLLPRIFAPVVTHLDRTVVTH